MEPITTTAAMVGAGTWFGNRLLGPTIDIIGTDLKELYEKGRDRIAKKAIEKTKNINEPGQTNLRVTRDVFWNGAFTDEPICAEYVGGVLASSRTPDGKDDSGVFFLDIIKSMSSGQLKMHYIIYRILNKEFLANPAKHSLNPGQETELGNEELFIPSLGLIDQPNQDLGIILHGLHARNLIGDFERQNHALDPTKVLPYLKFSPTSLGIQLFAIAYNRLGQWRNFAKTDFGDFENIRLPQYVGQSLPQLLESAGLKSEQEPVPQSS
jgi:hypothetical protein